MSRSRSQTLITGAYRTGTEYVAQLMGCHPLLSVTMYAVNALRFVYGRFDPIADLSRAEAAVRAIADRVRTRYDFTVPVDEVLARLRAAPRVTYGTLYDEVMCALHLRTPAEHWAEKNQLLWREIPLFLDGMSNGRAVLVLRDPRSVLVSFKKYTYAPAPAYLGAVFNCWDAMVHADRYAKELAADRFLVVRYEDAARCPQAQAERIWSFLGLSGGADVGDRRRWRDAHGRPWHANSSFHSSGDAQAFDVERSIERWREEITPAELALIEGVCGPLMERFGYTPATGAADWNLATEAIGGDALIGAYLRHWQLTGEGIQAFPTDPLDPKNWRDDA